MLIDLSDATSIEIRPFESWDLVRLKTTFKIARLFFRTKNEGRQNLDVQPDWAGSHYPHEYTVSRPAAVVPGITHLCAMGNPKQTWAHAWPARFDRGLVLVQLVNKQGTYSEYQKTQAIWISLWDDMEEDQTQLSFEWDVNRFDLIE